jgi:transmembrane sensor
MQERNIPEDGGLKAKRRQLLAEEAADWLERANASSTADAEAMMRWLKEQPAHINALLMEHQRNELLEEHIKACRVDVDALLARSRPTNLVHGPASGGLKNPAAEARRPDRWTHRWVIGVAASIALCLLAMPVIREALNPTHFRTSTGEQRSVSLPDGSIVLLDAQSQLRLRYSADARDVVLERGQANFRVARDAQRPFRVHTGSAVVQAVGTRFDVRVSPDRTSVAVLEGRVRVSSRAPTTLPPQYTSEGLKEQVELDAGQATQVLHKEHVMRVTRADTARTTAWQQRRLVFRDNTLEEILAEFARYNRHLNIEVDSEAIRSTRFSGTFDADDPAFLLMYLETDPSIVVDRAGDEVVIRAR